MGFGIMGMVKSYVPLAFYCLIISFVLMALIGKLEWPLAFLIALLPLRNVIDKLHAFPLGKDVVDIFLISLLIGLVVKGMSNKNQKIFENSPINGIAVVLIIYTFISVLQGSVYLNDYELFSVSNPRVQIWKNFCVLPLMFFITYNGIREKKWIWRIVLIMCITMIFMDYYLLRQISYYGSLASRNKIKGTFVFLGPNEVAAFYNQYTIILMSVYFYMKKSWAKLALAGLIVLNLFCILFILSRAAYVAMFVGMIFLFAIKNKKLLIPLVLVAIFWQVALPEKVRHRIEETTNEYGELDASSANRLLIWDQSWEMFSENPITGVGLGVFSQMGFRLNDTHNIYLKILAEQGLFGMLIFLILLFILFIQGVRLFIGGEEDISKGLGLGFAVAIIVLMCNNVFGDRWTYMSLSSNLWVFAALISRLIVLEINDKKLNSPRNRLN